MDVVYKDDRTDEQRLTHTVIVSAIDKFMSGWGRAANGKSVAAWACRPEHADRVFAWVKSRGEMRNVRMSDHAFRSGAEHTHIYTVNDGHASLREARTDV